MSSRAAAAVLAGALALPEDGEATRIADRFQDTMGFTVVGPSTFLGSGHPDSVEDLRYSDGTRD